MSEWKRVKLSQIGTIIGGGTPSTKQPKNYDGDIPWITPKDLSAHCFVKIFHGERSISQTGLATSSARLLPKGSILFSSRAPIGYVALAGCEVCTNQGFKSLVPNKELVSLFGYYLLVFNRDKIEALGSGTTFKEVSGSTMKDVEVDIPSIDTQRRIAAVLGALDDKIENNRKICANLEAQAQALFKSWFVDFEPFGGKMPSGWKISPLKDVIAFQEGPGIRNWQYVTKDGTRFINIRCINDGEINTTSANMISNEEAQGKYSHFMLRENDIVMSCSGTLGRYAIVRKCHLPLCLNTSVIRFYPKDNSADFSWIYGYLGSEDFLKEQEARANGSCQVNFGPTHLRDMQLLCPDRESRIQYNQIVGPLLRSAMICRDEICALAATRDALLPKLMSGEIDVEKVEV